MSGVKMNAVDVSQLAQNQRDPKILKEFDALQPGRGLILINDMDSRYFLKILQTTRRNSYEWWPLAMEADLWQVVIMKRSEATERTINDLLHTDHVRLHMLYEDHCSELDGDNIMLAAIRFDEFQTGLLRHIRMEEEVLFPLYEKKTENTMGPTHVMRMEHQEIQGLLKKMTGLLDEAKIEGLSKRDSIKELGNQIHEYLKLHNQKEEEILYPSSDQVIQGKEREELILKMEAV